RQALASYAATNTTLYRSYFRGLLAQLLLQSGEVDAAMQETEFALKDIAATGEHWWEPEVLRIRGECLLAASGSNSLAAADCFRKAIDEARRMKALTLELRAATSLARLLVTQSERAASRAILAPILGRFEEGSKDLDLRAAKEILDQLPPAS